MKQGRISIRKFNFTHLIILKIQLLVSFRFLFYIFPLGHPTPLPPFPVPASVITHGCHFTSAVCAIWQQDNFVSSASVICLVILQKLRNFIAHIWKSAFRNNWGVVTLPLTFRMISAKLLTLPTICVT